MKWPSYQVFLMQDGFEQFLQSGGFSIEAIRENYGDNLMMAVYKIADQVTFDLQFDDSHPAYHPGKIDGKLRVVRRRMVDYHPDFVLYPPGCHDSHRDTMLKHVAKQLGILD